MMDCRFSNSFKSDPRIDASDPNSFNAALHVSQMLSDIQMAKEENMYHPQSSKTMDTHPSIFKQKTMPGYGRTMSPSKSLKPFPQNSVREIFSMALDPSNKSAMNPLAKSVSQNLFSSPKALPNLVPFGTQESPYFSGNVPVYSFGCGPMDSNSFAGAEPIGVDQYNNHIFAFYDGTMVYPTNFTDYNWTDLPAGGKEGQPNLKKQHKLNPEAEEYIPQTMRSSNQNTIPKGQHSTLDNSGFKMNTTAENESGVSSAQSDYGFINNEEGAVHSDYGFINGECGTTLSATDSGIGGTESSLDLKRTGSCNTVPRTPLIPSLDVPGSSSCETRSVQNVQHKDLQNNTTDTLTPHNDANTCDNLNDIEAREDTNESTPGNDFKNEPKNVIENDLINGSGTELLNSVSESENEYSANDYSDDDDDDTDTEDEDDTDTEDDDTDAEENDDAGNESDDGICFEFGHGSGDHDDVIFGEEEEQGNQALSPKEEGNPLSTSAASTDTSRPAENPSNSCTTKKGPLHPSNNCTNQNFLLNQNSSDTEDDDDDTYDNPNYDCDLFKLDLEDDDNWGLPVGGGLIISQIISPRLPQTTGGGNSTSDGGNSSSSFSISILSPLIGDCGDLTFCGDGGDVDLCGYGGGDEVDSCYHSIADELAEVNRAWSEEVSKDVLETTPTKVTFSEDVRVESVEDWCRRGPWEQYARDSRRFGRRVEEAEAVLGPVLGEEHRGEVRRRRRRDEEEERRGGEPTAVHW